MTQQPLTCHITPNRTRALGLCRSTGRANKTTRKEKLHVFETVRDFFHQICSACKAGFRPKLKPFIERVSLEYLVDLKIITT